MSSPSTPLLTRVDESVVERVLAINPRCKRLNLSHNAIVDVADDDSQARADGGIPPSPIFARLPNLVFLNLSFNQLRSIGRAFAALPQLEVLDVSNNQM